RQPPGSPRHLRTPPTDKLPSTERWLDGPPRHVAEQRLRREPELLGHLRGTEELAATTGFDSGEHRGQRFDRVAVWPPGALVARFEALLESRHAYLETRHGAPEDGSRVTRAHEAHRRGPARPALAGSPGLALPRSAPRMWRRRALPWARGFGGFGG